MARASLIVRLVGTVWFYVLMLALFIVAFLTQVASFVLYPFLSETRRAKLLGQVPLQPFTLTFLLAPQDLPGKFSFLNLFSFYSSLDS
jgi:hypothetical protein